MHRVCVCVCVCVCVYVCVCVRAHAENNMFTHATDPKLTV